MQPTVHDLLRVRGPADLVNRDSAPDWVSEELCRVPWVVVRRAPLEGEFVPVGVRGQSRGARFAAFVHSSSIVEFVTPESLSSSQAWKKALRYEELPAMRALSHVHATLGRSGLSWGPVGSVGFELASGAPVASLKSDLDLIVRVSDFLIPPATTKTLLSIVQGNVVRVDLLLETMEGAISFLEYAGSGPNLLLRTVNGPSLIRHVRETTGERR